MVCGLDHSGSEPFNYCFCSGLLVRSRRGKKEKTNKFDYVWASFCSSRHKIDWTKLLLSTTLHKNSGGRASGIHIYLHKLHKDKSQSLYNSLLQSPNVKAVVLANTCNSYKVPHEFVARTDKPVLVVTKSTGESLDAVLRDPTEVRVEFDTEAGGGGEGQWETIAVGKEDEEMKLEWEDPRIMR